MAILIILVVAGIILLIVTGWPKSPPAAIPSYAELQDKYEHMTSAQFKPYARSLVGQTVQWTGRVLNAKSLGWWSGMGELVISLGPLDAPIRGLYRFFVPKRDLLKYNRGTEVDLRGRIKRIEIVDGALYVDLDGVTINGAGAKMCGHYSTERKG